MAAFRVFEYNDYMKYLSLILGARPRGERARFAKALKCHPTFVSQVFKGSADLSLEQATQVNVYLGHTKEESHYFLLLVSHARAATPALRAYYSDQLQEMAQKRLVLKHRLNYQKSLTAENQMTYYSAWTYAAVHMAVTVPHLRTKEALADYLNLPLKKISEILEFLTSVELVIEHAGKYKIGTASIHLGNDSPMISKHHTNWRMQSIVALEREDQKALHYSSVVTLARADQSKVKAIFIDAIEKARALIKDSPEECLCTYTVDFFEQGR